MDGYAKLASSIVGSTIWQEPSDTCKVWITMLALANKHGEVFASVPGLANFARVPIAATETALQRFLAPDPYSRSKDYDGRRIEEIEGGWVLLNYITYRKLMSAEDRREKDRVRKQRQRKTTNVPQMSANVRTCPQVSADVTQNHVYAESISREQRAVIPPTPLTGDEEKEKAREVLSRVRNIGFRESRSYSAGTAFMDEVMAGVDPEVLCEKLCRIYRWTKNGQKAPKLHEVIPRWREEQHLWDIDFGKGEGDGKSGSDQHKERAASSERAFAKYASETSANDDGNPQLLPVRPD